MEPRGRWPLRCPTGSAAALSGLARGGEHALSNPTAKEKYRMVSTFKQVGAGERRGRWTDVSGPPPTNVLAFWVVVRGGVGGQCPPCPLSGHAARLGHSGLGGGLQATPNPSQRSLS